MKNIGPISNNIKIYIHNISNNITRIYIVASELKDPICHSNECQIGSLSSEATIYSKCTHDRREAITGSIGAFY